MKTTQTRLSGIGYSSITKADLVPATRFDNLNDHKMLLDSTGLRVRLKLEVPKWW